MTKDTDVKEPKIKPGYEAEVAIYTLGIKSIIDNTLEFDHAGVTLRHAWNLMSKHFPEARSRFQLSSSLPEEHLKELDGGQGFPTSTPIAEGYIQGILEVMRDLRQDLFQQ